MKMKKGRGQEGIALVITLLVMTILLIMGSAFMSISSTETLIAINERNRVQAYHLAEAGAERAIAELNANTGYQGTPVGVDVNLAAGSYRVDVCPPRCSPPAITAPADPNQRILIAMGCVRNCTTTGSAMSRLQMRVQRGAPFQFAMLGVGDGVSSYRAVQLEDNVQVDSYDSALAPYDPLNPGTQGHIHSNGNIELGTNNTVRGNAGAVGSFPTPPGTNGNTVTGSSTTGVPSQSVNTSIPFPPPSGSTTGINPPAVYDTTTHDLTVGDNQGMTLAPGTYSFNKITLGHGSNLVISPPGQVTIYMAGRFFAGAGATINAGGVSTNLLIFSSNTGTDDSPAPANGEEAFFFCCDNASTYGKFNGAIYAPNGEVEVQNALDPSQGWEIHGAIVGKKLDIEDYARLHYDLALTRSSSPASKFRPMASSWQERLPTN